MPAAFVAAAATTTAAVIGSRTSNKAGDRQTAANTQALDYQKEKDAQDRADKEKDRALAKAAWDAEQARQAPRRAALAGLLRARGVNVPDLAPRYDPTGQVATGQPVSGGQAPSSLASFYGGPYQQDQMVTPPIQAPTADSTIADFFRRRQANLG